MTDQEKIEKLAAWMGWLQWPSGVKNSYDLPPVDNLFYTMVESKIGRCTQCVITEPKENLSRSWNPLGNIADA